MHEGPRRGLRRRTGQRKTRTRQIRQQLVIQWAKNKEENRKKREETFFLLLLHLLFAPAFRVGRRRVGECWQIDKTHREARRGVRLPYAQRLVGGGGEDDVCERRVRVRHHLGRRMGRRKQQTDDPKND